MHPLRFEQPALDDVEDAIEFLWEFGGEERANRFISVLESSADMLRRFPETGHRHDDLPTSDLRIWPFKDWSLVYAIEDDWGVVFRILRKGRDLRGIRIIR